MANFLYDKYREACLTKTGPSYSTGTIKVAMLNAKYSASQGSDQFLSGIIGAASSKLVKRSTTALASKTITAGVANAANFTVAAVPAGTTQVTQIVLYRDTGSDATSDVLVYINLATGLPFTPAGTNVTIAWSTTTNKIFKL